MKYVAYDNFVNLVNHHAEEGKLDLSMMVQWCIAVPSWRYIIWWTWTKNPFLWGNRLLFDI